MVSNLVPKIEALAGCQLTLTSETEKARRQLVKLQKGERAFTLTTAVQHAGGSAQVKVDFSDKKWPFIEIVGLADVQWGHKACKYKLLEEFGRWILDEPYRFVAGVGDLVDAAHMFSPGTAFDNLFEAQAGVFTFVETMAPIRHRFIGNVGGNHERRQVPYFGDLGKLLAVLLQLPYSGGRQMVRLKFAEHQPFRLMLWHGHPRARTKGALAQIGERYARIANAQLYLTGHNHQGYAIPAFREIHADGFVGKELYIVAAGTSFLDTFGTYADWMGFESYEALMPRARLFADGSWEYVIPSKLLT